MKTKYYDVNHPVAQVIEPLRCDAIKRSEEEARKVVASVENKLKEHDFDMNIAAPRPKSVSDDYMRKITYKRLVESLTKLDMSKHPSGSLRLFEPHYVVMSEKGCEQFIKLAIESANMQYTSFICKMIDKIGQCDSATLEGSHVWGFSFLTVKKGDDVEIWKTQQIVNVSSKNKIFNQWPRRKVKTKK